MGMELKDTFFKEGVKRLAGGIDNTFNWTDHQDSKTVKTDSFTIKLTKISTVGNKSPLPLGFELEAPALSKIKNTKGDVIVKIPNDFRILENSGPNALIAVIYATESGEEALNYNSRFFGQDSFRFASGVVKIVIASTP
jgi:hypothetical protein